MRINKIVFSWLGLILFFVFFIALRLDLEGRDILSPGYTVRPIMGVSSNRPPEINADSYLVMDVDTGSILLEKNAHQRLKPASITKMATAINALETYPLGEVITVQESYSIGKNMELQAGEKITVENLIYGLLVHSANDAGFVLAGQSEYKINQFIAQLNKHIEQLGLKNTHFVNFDGLDADNHYSSSFDLAHLARSVIKNKVFVRAIREQEMIVTDLTGEISHRLETTNELLVNLPEVKGIKTGWTPGAGECFIGLIEIKGRQFITVILGSEDRFGETVKLINWLKEN